MSAPPLSAASVEEAAHAYVAHYYGGVIERCEVFGPVSGRHKADGLSRRQRLRVKVAGYVGRRLVLGAENADPDLSEKDGLGAVEIAWKIVRLGEAKRLASRGLDEPDEAMMKRYSIRAEKLIEAAERDAEAILTANRGAVERLAHALEMHGTLSHETVRAIVAEAGPA